MLSIGVLSRLLNAKMNRVYKEGCRKFRLYTFDEIISLRTSPQYVLSYKNNEHWPAKFGDVLLAAVII